eukprot:15481971-Alexandrium_andersonii.AAC.1
MHFLNFPSQQRPAPGPSDADRKLLLQLRVQVCCAPAVSAGSDLRQLLEHACGLGLPDPHLLCACTT